MATLAELVNEVSDDIAREDLTSQCSDAVVMAIRHYDHKRWWFNEASQHLQQPMLYLAIFVLLIILKHE
jgi:thiamine phosphate synthase YjbQ (UPF0047 family)